MDGIQSSGKELRGLDKKLIKISGSYLIYGWDDLGGLEDNLEVLNFEVGDAN